MKELRELKEENRRLLRELKSVHYSTYLQLRQILKMTKSTRSSVWDLELAKKDVLGMVTEGAKRGERIDDILGGNAEDFVRSLLMNLRKRSRQASFFHYAFLFLAGAATICGAFWGLLGLPWRQAGGLVPVNLWLLASACVMGSLLVIASLRNYNWNEQNKRWLEWVMYTVQLALLLLLVWGARGVLESNRAVFWAPGWLPTAVLLVAALICRSLCDRCGAKQNKR